MKKPDDEDDLAAKRYFDKMQGDENADVPERPSSISPEEYLKREKEEKEKLHDEELRMKKSLEIMKASFFSISIGIICMATSFTGIFWILPYLCLGILNPVVRLAIFIFFLLIGIAGLVLIIQGLIKLFSTKSKVDGTGEF
ncbi:MAG: hypothetical protein RDV48_15305 [Candidatus Eremiobacteraeota bacterium]|nr:hypothetical protein [Candidatus Eremiobacteraeota bacterium]